MSVFRKNGSHLTNLKYVRYEICEGKPKLPGLPAVYTEDDAEAETLLIWLRDSVSGIEVMLRYSIYTERAVIARSVRITNGGDEDVMLERAMSMNLDLPDADYEWMQFPEAGRESVIRWYAL